MRIISLWVGKLIYSLLHLLRKRGAALPGLVVERLSPTFLPKTLDMLPGGVIIITGTNGKTTSTKMLTHVLGSRYRVLTNPTGSNFVRGIVASIIQHSSWTGALPYDIGVFELDEAYAAQFVKLYKPRGVVVLNIMRDQMDRFGEIDHTARLITEVVKNTTEFVILNAEDQRVSAMQNATKSNVYFFAVSDKLRDVFRTDDELHGGVSLSQEKVADATLTDFTDQNEATIRLGADILNVLLAAKGTYNAQNATAVCLAANVLGVDVAEITTKIAEVKPAFGRGERIDIGNKTVILQLVKNPGGFRHALLTGKQIKQKVTMIAINDDYADGRDVSWLWDVRFGGSQGVGGFTLTSGVRAADMALRLKYDDITCDIVEPKLTTALDLAIANCEPGGTVLIYTTYTAMLELRRILANITKVEKI